MQVLGTESFLSTPDVNGQLVLLNGGGTGTVSYGTLAARPAASTAGNLYVDTTSNIIWRDSGTAWVSLSASGTVLQVVTGSIPAITAATTTIPLDNTIPTSTEGTLIFTNTFTPLSATSRIIVSYMLTVAAGTGNTTMATTAFYGTTNIGAAVTRCATSSATAGSAYNLSLQSVFATGAVTPIVIQGRVGALSGATWYVNTHATTFFGGALVSEYTITEVL